MSKKPTIKQLEKRIIELEQQQLEYQQLFRSLERSNAQNESIIRSAIDAIVTIDSNGIVQVWNNAAKEMFGFSESEMLQNNLSNIIPERHKDAHEQGLSRLMDGGEEKLSGKVIELTGVKKDGTKFPIEFSVSRWQDNTQIFFSAMIRDVSLRSEAQRLLQRSHDQFKKLYTETPAMLHSIDAEGRLVSVSNHWLDTMGYSRDEVLGRKSSEFLTEASRDYATNVVLPDFFKTGRCIDIPYQFVKKDGAIIDVLLSATAQRDDENNIIHSFAVITDVTEKRKIEETLRREDAKHLALIENISDIIAIVDVNGVTQYKSPNIEKLFGWKPEELVGENTWNNIHNDDLDRTQSAFANLLKTEGTSQSIEFRYLCKDGSYKWVEATASNHVNDSVINGVLLNYHDISVRKLAEEALRENESLLRAMAENYPNSYVSIIEEDLTVGFTAGPEFKKLDLDPNQFVGLTLEQVFGENATFVKDMYLKTFDGTEQQFELFINNQYQSYKTVPLLNKDDQVTRIMAVVENITERKQAEEQNLELANQLRQAQKLEAVGTMVGGISHELNNILQSMFLYGGLVKDELPENGEMRRNMEHLLKDGERARDIVKRILTFSRKTLIDLKPQPLHDLIIDALALERVSFPANIEITQDIGTDCGLVLCDKTQVHQIILNLCNNAQHAMHEKGGTLFVRLKQILVSMSNGDPKKECLELTISDTGHGIESADLERIFDPFFTTKKFGQGTGLGLSVIHGIVEMMQGTISATSQPGEGTTFRILIPVVDKAKAVSTVEPTSIESSDSSDSTLLLVDDEDSIRNATEIILRRKGFTVESAANGTEALEIFKANPAKFDIIVTDQSMPKLSGSDLTREIRKLNTEIPIILSSGKLGIKEQEDFNNIGISKFIQKPWTAIELIARIQAIDT